jgi:polar amino acid transport system substrate-binding protein
VLGRFALICALLLSGCGIPRDASHTLERARNGVLRIGVVANDPWVIDRGSTVGGIEARLVTDVASSIGARIEWVRAPEFELIRALHKRDLQLVIGGFDRKVRWAPDVALTRPYLQTADGKAHVLAAPPGENAWLMLLDRHVERFKPSVSNEGAGAER